MIFSVRGSGKSSNDVSFICFPNFEKLKLFIICLVGFHLLLAEMQFDGGEGEGEVKFCINKQCPK